MTLTVEHVQKYGKDLQGRPAHPYMEEVSRKIFTHNGSNYLLEQGKNDRGIMTKLFSVSKNGNKFLLREKLISPGSIYRSAYDVYGRETYASCIPRSGTGEYWFYTVKDGKFDKRLMTGLLHEGKIVTNPNGFKIAEQAGNSIFHDLGGGAKPIFKKILKFLLTKKL